MNRKPRPHRRIALSIFVSAQIAWILPALASRAEAQQAEVSIPRGRVIQLSWIAPVDEDVVAYRAWFISASGDTSNITIPVSGSESPLDTLSYMTSILLPVGAGKLMMTAKDAAGNQSVFSDPAFYRVFDGAPGRPFKVNIKVL